jgi:hypothetical protein
LPNSLTRVLPFALVYSTHRPVSVLGTGGELHHDTRFSWLQVPLTSGLRPASRVLPAYHPLPLGGSDFLKRTCTTPFTGTGILTRCPSPTLLSLGLGPTNPTRTDLPSEPFDVRRQWFSHCFRYSCQHSHSCTLQQTLPVCLLRLQNAPLPNVIVTSQVLSFGGVFSPVTFSAQSRLTSELLRTL